MRRARAGAGPTNDFVEFTKAEIEQSIPARFEQQVRRYPDRLAIKTRRHQLSYDALNRAANRMARGILEHGPRQEEPIALLLGHDAPFIAALLAVLKTGNIYVPLDPAAPRPRLVYILDDAQAGLILADASNVALAEALAGPARRVLDVDAIAEQPADDNPGLTVSPDALATITYTSGSTGEPKGVVHDHRALLHVVMRRTNSLHISSDDRFPLLLPLGFSAARQVALAALLNGAALFPYDVKQHGLRDLAGWLIREELTLLHWTPTGFRNFCGSLTGEERFPKLRLVALAAEPLSAGDVKLFERHFPGDCIFANYLGSTETGTTRMYFLDRQARLPGHNVPVGYALEDMEVLLLDEADEPVGFDRPGEIVVKSRYLARGYWRKPEHTATTFLPTPDGEHLYRTGDLGRMWPDGCLEVLGRKDSMVKIRGHRVEPTEVELALLALGTVREAAVVGREDGRGGQQLVAYVVPRSGQVPAASELRGFLRERLPEYMVPAVFVPLEALPLTPNGKVDRRALPAPERTRDQASDTFVAPRTPAERELARLWADLLGLERVGIHDDFFDLGGHSLLAAQLVARIEAAFGARLPLTTLFQGGTIERLAEAMQQQPSAWPSLVPLQTGGSRPPFYCVHALECNASWYALARALGPDQPVYGIQARGLDGVQEPLETIEEMAAHYLAEVRAVQPAGPYYLGGFSAGGKVAFEMARQLVAAGQEVAVLAIIDTRAKTSGRKSQSLAVRLKSRLREFIFVHWLDQVVALRRRFGKGDQRASSSRLGEFLKMGSQGRRQFLESFRELRKLSVPGASPDIDKVVDAMAWLLLRGRAELPEHHRRVIGAFCRALVAYTPRPYSGRIELFRSSSFSSREADLGWGKLAAGGVGIREVSVRHHTMMRERNVHHLARELRQCLDEARARSGGSRPARDPDLAQPDARTHASAI